MQIKHFVQWDAKQKTFEGFPPPIRHCLHEVLPLIDLHNNHLPIENTYYLISLPHWYTATSGCELCTVFEK